MTKVNTQNISNIFIVGTSGSGKTCLTINILNKLKYDKLWILTPGINEDKYQYLKSTTEDILLTNEGNTFPCPSKLDKETETVVVFDNVEFCEDENQGAQLMREYLQLDLKYYNKLKIICISQSFHNYSVHSCFAINNYLHILFKVTPFDRLKFSLIMLVINNCQKKQ
jgi:Cdc6-like AAA superfamily ATPase